MKFLINVIVLVCKWKKKRHCESPCLQLVQHPIFICI